MFFEFAHKPNLLRLAREFVFFFAKLRSHRQLEDFCFFTLRLGQFTLDFLYQHLINLLHN